MEDKKPKAKREYKDTVFRMLFSDKKNLLSLYNAVTGRAHENAEDFEIVTLDNAVYMGMKNDLSFLLDTHIYLYEHQSTKNPNMPLRDLFYISLEYQKYVSDKSLYSSTAQKLPHRYSWCFTTAQRRGRSARSFVCRRHMNTLKESRIWN